MTERQKRFSKVAFEDGNQIKEKDWDDDSEEYASGLEAFIDKYLAPEVLSNQGRVFILLLWAIMTGFTLIGANQVTMDFSMELFLIPGEPVT